MISQKNFKGKVPSRSRNFTGVWYPTKHVPVELETHQNTPTLFLHAEINLFRLPARPYAHLTNETTPLRSLLVQQVKFSCRASCHGKETARTPGYRYRRRLTPPSPTSPRRKFRNIASVTSGTTMSRGINSNGFPRQKFECEVRAAWKGSVFHSILKIEKVNYGWR